MRATYKRLLAAEHRTARVAAELSVDEIRGRINDALAEKYGRDEQGFRRARVDQMFMDHAIVSFQEKLWRVSFTLKEDGTAELGEMQGVEPAFAPTGETMAQFNYIETLCAADAKPADTEGLVWEFVFLRAGPAEVYDAKSGLQFYFTPEFVAHAVTAFAGAHAYADHQAKPVGSIRNVVGFWTELKLAEGGQEARGHLRLFEAEDDLRKKLQSAWKAGRPDLIGVSVRAIVDGKPKFVAGKKYFVPAAVDVSVPRSIDLVPVGAVSGAHMVRLVASNNRAELLKEFSRQSPSGDGGTLKKEEPRMKWQQLLQLMLAAIRGWSAERAAALERELAAIPEADPKRLEQVTEVYVECMNGQFARVNASAGEGVLAEITAAKQAAETMAADAKKVLDEVKAENQKAQLAACKTVLQASLNDSKLPVPARKEIERRFADRVFSADELKKEIEAVREVCAALVSDGRVAYPVISGRVLDQYDKLEIALCKTFGVTKDEKGADLPAEIPAFTGIRHAYVEFTGDAEVTGRPNQTRLSAIFNNAGFPNALANTMTRQLIRDYAAVDYRWRDIVSTIGRADNFKTQERIRVGYFGDLATVDPEAADYAELAAYTDEKISLAVIQKGNVVTVTRKMIINDDLNTIMKVNQRLARSAARTLAKRVWNVPIANPNYDVDGVALFHATHNNLGSTVLGSAALTAAEELMFKQTEKDSNERLGLRAYLLAVPIELWDEARDLNQATQGGANQWFHRFGENNERIIVNPLQTDATDWILLANPAEVETIEVDFLQGRQEPEFFLADAIPAEQVFVADKIRFKIRHEYEADALDFRGMFKAVVAG